MCASLEESLFFYIILPLFLLIRCYFYVCENICACLGGGAHVLVGAHECVCSVLHVCMCMCVCVYLHVFMYMCVYMFACVCVLCMYVCVCVVCRPDVDVGNHACPTALPHRGRSLNQSQGLPLQFVPLASLFWLLGNPVSSF